MRMCAGDVYLASLGSTYFMLRSAAYPGLCMEVPRDENGTSPLTPCSTSSADQRLRVKVAGRDGFGHHGYIFSHTRPNFYLCGYRTFYSWNTKPCPAVSELGAVSNGARARAFYFTGDETRIRSVDWDYIGTDGQMLLGCFVADNATSSVLYGACNAPSEAGSWIIDTPGMPSSPAFPGHAPIMGAQAQSLGCDSPG